MYIYVFSGSDMFMFFLDSHMFIYVFFLDPHMFIFVLSVVDGMKMRSKVQANGSPKAKERNSIVRYSFKLTHNIVTQFIA